MERCHASVLKKEAAECFFECEEGGRLDPYETLYELKKGKVVVKDHSGTAYGSWFEALKDFSVCEPRAWIMFSVYYDLRERGRVLRTGPLPNSFTMFKGPKPEALVIVLEETVKFVVEEIFQWMETARKMGRECLLAIVDKHGDVSYYKLEPAVLRASSLQ